MPVGTSHVRSKAAIQLGKFSLEEKDLATAETLFLESLREVASIPILEHLENASSSPVVLPENIVVNDYQLLSLIELGKLYVKQGRFQDGLFSFLATLRSLRNGKEIFKNSAASGVPIDLHMRNFDVKCNEPVIMTYISEILWKLTQKNDAIIWAEGSYYDSFPKSHDIVECGLCAKIASNNLYKMYKNMGLYEQSDIFKQLSESQVVLDRNPKL